MVTREEALQHLNLDRNYEDKLVVDINLYLLDSLISIDDMTKEEKEKITSILSTIIEDSQRHSFMLTLLIEYVVKSAKNNF